MDFVKEEKIQLKKKFGKETSFSQWLASNEGKTYLEEKLGVQLRTLGTEVKPNNAFSTDIVFEVIGDYEDDEEPAKVVVENQYGRTNHEHFSKLITYAFVNKAKYAIWITEDVHHEHKDAIGWLNNNTNENINFYLFKASITRQGNADSFSLTAICEPDEKLKIDSVIHKKEMTPLEKMHYEFWESFKDHLVDKKLNWRIGKASGIHWNCLNLIKFSVNICLLTKERKIRIDYWITDNKPLFKKLFSKKDEIEKNIGHNLIWDPKDSAKASSISYLLDIEFDPYNKKEFALYFDKIIYEISNHFIKLSMYLKK